MILKSQHSILVRHYQQNNFEIIYFEIQIFNFENELFSGMLIFMQIFFKSKYSAKFLNNEYYYLQRVKKFHVIICNTNIPYKIHTVTLKFRIIVKNFNE